MLAGGTVHQGDEVGEKGLLFVGGGSDVRAGLEGSVTVVVEDEVDFGTVMAVWQVDVTGARGGACDPSVGVLF